MIRKMKNKVGVLGVLLIVFAVFLLLFSANPVSAKNKFQWITYENKGTKIGNAVFNKEKQQDYDAKRWKYCNLGGRYCE